MKYHEIIFLLCVSIFLSSCSQLDGVGLQNSNGVGKANMSLILSENEREAQPSVTPGEAFPTECELPLPKENYASLDIAEEWARIKEIDTLNGNYWESTGKPNLMKDIRDSSLYDVALHFAGYPNTDETSPSQVTVVYTNPANTIVTVLSVGLLDDSILDREYRIDLSESDGIWTIDWAGVRYRCARSGNFDWTTSLCP